MKRILSLALVTLMLLSTFALTSCDFESMDVNAIIQQVMEGLGLAEKEPVYTITQEEWEANMNATNVTIEMTVTQGEMSISYCCWISENAVKVEGDAISKDAVVYFVKDGDVYYMILETNGQQYVQEASADEFVDVETIVGAELPLEDFEYNEEEKCYVYSISDEETGEVYGACKIYFLNGVIQSIKTEVEYDDDDKFVMDIVFTNVGTTVVEVPEFDRP